ncbi:hypothetical protein [Tenacibaculum ovolyticum]|uniref:hypothetical protein n=1 Tax=Tenacibaculum ovolyticum TaxID=104270 RepID=UPI0004297287|nr:hypothetical protein [Tenacibaculum ovolyticum]
MKKSILNLGKSLSKTAQKDIFGGSTVPVNEDGDGGGGDSLKCYCNGTTYPVAHCKWCTWKCGAGKIEDCR